MIGFQNGFIFKIWPRGYLEIFKFSAPKKGGLGKTQRELTDLEWYQKKIYLVGYLFCNFLGINTHNFVKNDPKFENKGLHFMQNFMKLNMRNF